LYKEAYFWAISESFKIIRVFEINILLMANKYLKVVVIYFS